MRHKSHTKVLREWYIKEVVKIFKIEFYQEIARKLCYFQYSVGYLIDFYVLDVYYIGFTIRCM